MQATAQPSNRMESYKKRLVHLQQNQRSVKQKQPTQPKVNTGGATSSPAPLSSNTVSEIKRKANAGLKLDSVTNQKQSLYDAFSRNANQQNAIQNRYDQSYNNFRKVDAEIDAAPNLYPTRSRAMPTVTGRGNGAELNPYGTGMMFPTVPVIGSGMGTPNPIQLAIMKMLGYS